MLVRAGAQGRGLNSGYLINLTKILTLSEFNRSTDHDRQDRIDVLRSRVSTLLNPLGEIMFVTEHP